jgi:hypothetical protein
MRLVTELSYWEITLVDGRVVEVWADGYQELDGPTYLASSLTSTNRCRRTFSSPDRRLRIQSG